MQSRKAPRGAVPARLDRARVRFGRWRERRERRTISEALWRAAVTLAADYGVYRTARTLGLNYESLKQRVQAASSDAKPSPGRPASFWELIPGAAGVPPGPAYLVELEDGRGRKLRVQWTGEFAELSAGRFRYWPGEPGAVRHELLSHQLQMLLAGGDPAATHAAPQWRSVALATEG